MKDMYIKKFDKLCMLLFCISQIFLYTFAITILLASFLFIFNIKMGVYILPLGAVLALILFRKLNNYQFDKNFFLTCVLAFVLFYILIYLSGHLVDFSYDGNSYHKVAVGFLNNGWDPLYQRPSEIGQHFPGLGNFTWVECYPKATWIFAASIYAITGNIECGKVYTLISIFCVFGITVYYLISLGYSKVFSVLFSLAAATNPIALSQFDTFYVDGCLQLLVFIFLISLLMSLSHTSLQLKIISNYIAAACLIISFNIKFTGALFVCFYGGIFFVLYCVYEYLSDREEWFELSLKKLLHLGIASFLAVAIVGGSTYITNYIRHGNIGYPLIGKNAINIMGSSAFESSNRFSNLFYSLFSHTENLVWRVHQRKPSLKIPFTYSLEREHVLAHRASTDMRIGGFGPLFSGLLVVSLLLILIRLLRHPKSYSSYVIFFILLTSSLLCAIIKESWWARYAPYLYFVVLCGIYSSYLSSRTIFKGVSLIMCFLLILNNTFFILRIPEIIHEQTSVFNEIKEMKKYGSITYKYERGAFGPFFNMVDSGIIPIRNEQIEDICVPRAVPLMRISWCPRQYREEVQE